MIDVQTNPGTKTYAAVGQAIVLASRSEGVSRAELTKVTGMDLTRWGTRMAHHPDWPGKGHEMRSRHNHDGTWHFWIASI